MGIKIYQNLKVDGEVFNVANKKRENSKYWNEGKFGNFIKPHLPEDCTDMSFVEVGSNAGLFLRMSKDLGFRDVIGFEKDKTPVEEGNRYRKILNYDYKLLKRKIGYDFNIDDVPMADYTLLSTVHYYFGINDWVKYVNRLKEKTRNVIIVSRDTRNEHWLAKSDIESIRKYFKDWKEVSYIKPIKSNGDPHPREDLWSICFRNKELERTDVKEINIGNSVLEEEKKKLIAEIAEKKEIEETSYFKKWKKRKKGEWSEKKIKNFVYNKIKMFEDVISNGVKEPIIIQDDYKLSDGGHRLSILKNLGYKSVITRKV